MKYLKEYGNMCTNQFEVVNMFAQRHSNLRNILQGTVKLNVMLSVQENQTLSSSQIALENKVSHTTVLKRFHKKNKLDRKEVALQTILFSDESTLPTRWSNTPLYYIKHFLIGGSDKEVLGNQT